MKVFKLSMMTLFIFLLLFTSSVFANTFTTIQTSGPVSESVAEKVAKNFIQDSTYSQKWADGEIQLKS
jgi:hypothetical protein